jgi:hypothetical protein
MIKVNNDMEHMIRLVHIVAIGRTQGQKKLMLDKEKIDRCAKNG